MHQRLRATPRVWLVSRYCSSAPPLSQAAIRTRSRRWYWHADASARHACSAACGIRTNALHRSIMCPATMAVSGLFLLRKMAAVYNWVARITGDGNGMRRRYGNCSRIKLPHGQLSGRPAAGRPAVSWAVLQLTVTSRYAMCSRSAATSPVGRYTACLARHTSQPWQSRYATAHRLSRLQCAVAMAGRCTGMQRHGMPVTCKTPVSMGDVTGVMFTPAVVRLSHCVAQCVRYVSRD